MAFRAPRIIWRLLAGDLVRTLLISTVSLVSVLGFAGAVLPLANGKVGLTDALMLALLLAVPMLQYALPFSAGFAATMAYHRFASDNEAMACMAGGVGHRTLLTPALAVGVLSAVCVAWLTTAAIPGFLQRAEMLVRRDVTRALLMPISRGEPIALGPWHITARAAVTAELTEQDKLQGAFQHIVLLEVIAIDSASLGEDPVYVSADRVDLRLSRHIGATEREAGTVVQFRFSGTTGTTQGGEVRAGQTDSKPILVPGTFRDDPKFLTAREMREAIANPRALGPADRHARRLAQAIAQERASRLVNARLMDAGGIVLMRSNTPTGNEAAGFVSGFADERFQVQAGELASADGAGLWSLVPAAGSEQIVVDRIEPSTGRTVRHVADAGWIEIHSASSPGANQLLLTLQLDGVRAAEVGIDAEEAEIAQRVYTGLSLGAGDPLKQLIDAPVHELLAQAKELVGTEDTTSPIAEASVRLSDHIEDQNREILSKQHERMASSIAGLLIVPLGAIGAMRRPNALPLPAYLPCFFPALGAVIMISAGQGMTHDEGPPGLILLWAGVAALAAYVGAQYALLRRH